jgi:ATP-dependent exoDNAse (exonuclease V) beta subunit
MPILTMLARDDFARLYGRRLGKRLAVFTRWCRELLAIPTSPIAECVEKILVHSELRETYEDRADRDGNVDDRIENLRALVNRAAEFDLANPDATLDAFLEDVALVADIDSWKSETRSVTLMTLHSAKGLEFPIVFIVGLEEQLLPHSNALAKNDIDEERRLFYVGITRAEKRLFISHAAKRFMWGKTSSGQPSRFLRELPPDHIHRIGIRLDDEDDHAEKRRRFLAMIDACEDFDPPFDDNDPCHTLSDDDSHTRRADTHVQDADDDTSLTDADAATRNFLAAHKPTDAKNPAADRIDKYVRGQLKAFNKKRPQAKSETFKKFIESALSPNKTKPASSSKKKTTPPAHKKRPAGDVDEYGVNQLPPDWDD